MGQTIYQHMATFDTGELTLEDTELLSSCQFSTTLGLVSDDLDKGLKQWLAIDDSVYGSYHFGRGPGVVQLFFCKNDQAIPW